MTTTTTTPTRQEPFQSPQSGATTRQERGRQLAQQGGVKALDAARTVFHVKSSQAGRAPYTVRHLTIHQDQWRCTCPDARHHTCKHIYAAQYFLQMPRFLVASGLRCTSVACRAIAPGVAFEEEAALVRHHETGNVTLELGWAIHYVEYLATFEAPRGMVAVLRAECGMRWYVPLEAWRVIQPLAMRNPSPEVEMAMLGVAS